MENILDTIIEEKFKLIKFQNALSQSPLPKGIEVSLVQTDEEEFDLDNYLKKASYINALFTLERNNQQIIILKLLI